MWWNKFGRRLGPTLLTAILMASLVIVAVGPQLSEAQSDPGGRQPAAAMGPTASEVAGGDTSSEKAPTGDQGAAPTEGGDTASDGPSQPGDPPSVSPPADPSSSPSDLSENLLTPPKRVGIQAGHWQEEQLPDELAVLRRSTGTMGGGVTEPQLTLDIAQRVASFLQAAGVTVDVLPATIPIGYKSDAFVALHADGSLSPERMGYKAARPKWSTIPQIDDAFVGDVTTEYAVATNLASDQNNVTSDMTQYYAFNNRVYKHAVSPSTPSIILEMGYLTNDTDDQMLLGDPDTVADGIAQGILRFLGAGSGGL